MKTVGKVLAAAMLAKGALLALTPRGFVNFWTGEKLPACIRSQAKLWQGVPEGALRQLGVGLMVISAVMVGVSRHHPR